MHSSAKASGTQDKVYLVSYPKIVFLYPSFLLALFAGLYMKIVHNDMELPATHALSWIFLVVLSLNLIVLSFDFPRTTSLTLFFIGVAMFLGGMLLLVYYPHFLPFVGELLLAVRPFANSSFYFVFTIAMGFIYMGVMLNRRFDYWEVLPNELLHHHGFLSDLERFPAPQLRIDKEINDVFEYMLLGSGRLILHPSNEPRAIILENVFWISRKEAAITNMLGTLQVQLRTTSDQSSVP